MESMDRLNEALLMGKENIWAQYWIDKCFDMVVDFVVTHGPLEYPEMVQFWPEKPEKIVGREKRREIVELFFNDLYQKLDDEGPVAMKIYKNKGL